MRIKENIFHILLVISMLCMMSIPVSANEDTVRVFDYADLLTEEEEKELNELCLDKESALETELYILTTNDTEGKETVDYTDDFGDEHAFGYDKAYGNYMILCIDMQNRMVWLSTSGKAEMYFTEARIDALIDALYSDLKAGNYFETCYSYIQSGEKYLSEEPIVDEITTDPDRYQDTIYKYDEVSASEPIFGSWYIRLAVSAIIGAILVMIMSFQARTKMTVNERTYSQNGVRVHNRTDAFIRRTTTSRKIESNNSGGRSSGGHSRGGGGHHTSSGGHSHGGGGRSF